MFGRRRPRPLLAGLVALASLGCGSATQPDPFESTANSDRASAGLVPVNLKVRERMYTRWDQGSGRLELRLERPQPSEAALMLCVPGTYTGPDDRVEGVVLERGKVVSRESKGWAAMLEITEGRAQIGLATNASFTPSHIDALVRQGASLLQGHLLVHKGVAQRFVNEPALMRRALVTVGRETWILESHTPVGLGDFARDLSALGASEAMNLDMGKWSEGWVRVPGASEVRVLGEASESTSRQSNWLVFVG